VNKWIIWRWTDKKTIGKKSPATFPEKNWTLDKDKEVYQIKKTSDVMMSSSSGLKMCHVWVYGIEGGGLGERLGPTACGKQSSRFSARVRRGSHLALKAIKPSNGFFAF
jgi:hypothetical protein